MVKDLNRSFSILFLFLKNDQKQESPLRWWRHLVPCWPCSCVCVCVCVFCMHVIFIYMVYGVLICILSSACRLEFPSWGYNHLNWIVLCLHVLLSAVCKRTCRKSFTNQWIPSLGLISSQSEIWYFAEEGRQQYTSTLHLSPLRNVSTSQTEGNDADWWAL